MLGQLALLHSDQAQACAPVCLQQVLAADATSLLPRTAAKRCRLGGGFLLVGYDVLRQHPWRRDGGERR